MANKKQNETDEQLAGVEQALSTSEMFLEKNKKPILYGLGIIVVIVLAVLAFFNFYMKPKSSEAATEIARAQAYFAVDSFRVALQGDGMDCIGFEEIADSYSLTASGNLARAYAGICYYQLGQYEDAAKMLKKYKGKDINVAPAAMQLLGDSYVELGDTKKAIACFENVAGMKNKVISPMSLKKAGIAYESLGDTKAALKVYQAIKDDYPQSAEAADIDKYIARLQ